MLALNGKKYVPLNENDLARYFFIKDELARGRVEICHNGSYDTVCSEMWENSEASVVCQQLGFSQYGKTAYIIATNEVTAHKYVCTV